MENTENTSKKRGLGYYLDFSEVLFYFFRKKDEKNRFNFNIRVMHGINKLSILMFIFGMLFLAIKLLFRN